MPKFTSTPMQTCIRRVPRMISKMPKCHQSWRGLTCSDFQSQIFHMPCDMAVTITTTHTDNASEPSATAKAWDGDLDPDSLQQDKCWSLTFLSSCPIFHSIPNCFGVYKVSTDVAWCLSYRGSYQSQCCQYFFRRPQIRFQAPFTTCPIPPRFTTPHFVFCG